MNECLNITEEYYNRFQQVQSQLMGFNLPWMQALRQQALAAFVDKGFPRREENWKYTDVSALTKKVFTSAVAVNELVGFSQTIIENTRRLVFVDGHFAPNLSDIEISLDVLMMPLAQALEQHADKIQSYLSMDNAEHFLYLHNAFMSDGLFLYVPKNTRLTQPIHLLYVNTSHQADVLCSPRNLIIVEDQSECTVIEEHMGMDEASHFKNVFTQIFAAAAAKLDYYKIQNENAASFHIANTHVHQQANSQVQHFSVSLGAHLARDDIKILLQEKGAETALRGLYLLSGQQHIDHHTRIDHLQSHCNSFEHYKGIVGDQGKAVFNGKVIVHPQAQKTCAHQTNQNLLLSKSAEINTKPELEIYADDVKCTHGATIGQVDDESLFYLRARGITETEALALLVAGFAGEMLEYIKQPSVFQYLEQRVMEKIAKRRLGVDAGIQSIGT